MAPTVGPRLKSMVNTRKHTNAEDLRSTADQADIVNAANMSQVLRELQEEMAAMKRRQERDAAEIEKLRQENARLLKNDPSWKPTTDPATQATEASSFHTHRSVGHTDPPTQLPSIRTHPTSVQQVHAPSSMGSFRHPFTAAIMATPLQDNLRALPLDKYDGATDPDEHVNVFLTQVTLNTTDDAALCRIFPTSLKGRALSWFTRLPPNTIDSFERLASLFTIQFATSRPHQLTSLAVVNIRQEKKESLRAFMERFNRMTLEIKDLNPAVALHHLTTALKPGPFVNSLCKKPPVDMDDLRRRADKYMQMEELHDFRNQVRIEIPQAHEKLGESARNKGKEVQRERPL